MPTSAYIHIPFCKSKCKYCSFVSFNKPELMTGYVYSLLKEISEEYSGEKLKTLYFGGGTPSLLPINLVEKIINKFNIDEICEITFEVNPDDANLEYFENLYKYGINRISIGSQTFDDNILKLIGRRHNSKDIVNAVNYTKQAGFKNISVDLIYGLPNQTIKSLKTDLENFIELDIQHISTYGLKIDKDSYFYSNMPENLPDDDTQADMYEMINNILEKNNFKRYEISNFAKLGYESKHNLNYWNNEEYYGFGVSSHGYKNGIRYSNYCTLEEYMNNPTSHEFGHFLTDKEKLEEEIFLGFRKEEGVNVNEIDKKYNINFNIKYSSVIEKYKDFIEKTPQGYKLNLNGVLISNVILAEFI